MTCGEIDHSPRQRDQATSNLSTWTRHVDHHHVLDSSNLKGFADHNARSAQATLLIFFSNRGPERPATIGGYGVNIVEDTFRGDFEWGVHQQSGPEARPRAPRWSNNVCFFFFHPPLFCAVLLFSELEARVACSKQRLAPTIQGEAVLRGMGGPTPNSFPAKCFMQVTSKSTDTGGSQRIEGE